MIRCTFAFSHTGFGRLLRNRLVWKQPNPNFAAALDEAGHRHTAGLDLPVGDPSRFKDFQAVIPERQFASTPGFAGHASALLLAVLNFFRHQHKINSWLLAIGCWPKPLLLRSPDDLIARSPDYFCILTSDFLKRSYRLRLALLGRQNFATVNPRLHANHAVSGARFAEAVFDISTQRV